MTDARISVELPRHPKTKKLIRRVGEGGAYRLVCLFLWAAGNRSDGDLAGMSDEDIELSVDWSGEPGAFVRALSEVGFLDGDEGQRSIHGWAEHNPWAAGAEARSEKSRWAALCKQHGRRIAAQMMPDYARRIEEPASSSASGSKSPADGTQNNESGTASGTDKSATGTPSAVPDCASGTQPAGFGSAPSPSPSPFPSPSPLPTSKDQSPIGDLSSAPAAPLPPPKPKPERPKAGKPLSVADLVSEGADPQHAADWMAVRARKKAPLTATAWEAVKREARAAGIKPAEAVKVCAERGWQSFNAAWNWRGDQSPPQGGPPAQRARTVRELSL